MKYAIIVLVALYLIITYGCSPDGEEKATESHEQTAPASVEALPATETVAIPVQQEEHAAPVDAKQHQTTEATEQTVAAEQPADFSKQPTEIEQAPKILAVTNAEETQSEVQEAPPTMVEMPCGRKVALADLPPNAPCLKMQQAVTQEPIDEDQTLTATLQKLVETTNEMVLATRQMASALQEMLATKPEVAKEVGEEKHVASKTQEEQEKESVEPERSAEQSAIEMMQEVTSAAQDVIDATNKAISKALETKQQ